MISIPVSAPFQVIGTDIMGPFPVTNKGNRYIITFTDHFTKWVEAFAIPRIDALTIAKIYVEDIICRHGLLKDFFLTKENHSLEK